MSARIGRMAAAGLLLLGLVGGSALTAAPAKKAAAPAFTAEEAEAGAQVYAGACAMCHGAALQGTYEVPPLTGRFVANWANAPVGALHAYLRKAMPQFAPGSLSEQDAMNLAAYLIKANGLKLRAGPAGAGDARMRAVITAGQVPR